MIATYNQSAPKDIATLTTGDEQKIKSLANPAQLLLPGRFLTHSKRAGLNPLVDAAGYLFSIVGKLKYLKSYRHLDKLQKELINEITAFQETIKHQLHNPEYVIICRYVLCATFDDIISNTSWGAQGQWDSFSLLTAFNQDMQHHTKFFTILDRAIKEPSIYIDLMELMYICLSLGYKGQYRATEHSQYQLEQITDTLYKHIRAFRGDFTKTLSPTPLKTAVQNKQAAANHSLLFIFFVTACIIMTIFVSLGYLMDAISNEAYTNISQIQTAVSHETFKQ